MLPVWQMRPQGLTGKLFCTCFAPDSHGWIDSFFRAMATTSQGGFDLADSGPEPTHRRAGSAAILRLDAAATPPFAVLKTA
jgi:hypothetical protein